VRLEFSALPVAACKVVERYGMSALPAVNGPARVVDQQARLYQIDHFADHLSSSMDALGWIRKTQR
jgi:hypothetical protein